MISADSYAKSASETAQNAIAMLLGLQEKFSNALQEIAKYYDENSCFLEHDWLRDEGKHGGGMRLGIEETSVFNRATVNFSHVHYDDVPEKKLRSATALSTIIHPQHACVPSVHLHFSWTELRDGSGSWRLMADLNPALPDEEAQKIFSAALKNAAPDEFKYGVSQGEKYFFIPVLNTHRGVFHFYLEGYTGENVEKDFQFSEKVAHSAIDAYLEIFEAALKNADKLSAEDSKKQLDYHTLYLFQVLTLDRGTTTGLLVHSQNDVGILGSLPTYVNAELLRSFKEKMQSPQEQLLDDILNVLGRGEKVKVTLEKRAELAQVLRRHYVKNPQALQLQASGFKTSPIVANHLQS